MSDQPNTTAPGNTGNPADAGEAAEANMDLSDFTVLIVDDNAQNVELMQAYLETLPCRILTAYDGLEAIRIIDESLDNKPDLILLDVMMPRMSGFEVCRKLKEDPATRSIPVMMVTALNELGDIERGVESGTDDFLTKPVNKLELLTRVKSLLRVRHLKRELNRLSHLRATDTRPHIASPGVTDDANPTEPAPNRNYPVVDDNDDPGAGPVA